VTERGRSVRRGGVVVTHCMLGKRVVVMVMVMVVVVVIVAIYGGRREAKQTPKLLSERFVVMLCFYSFEIFIHILGNNRNYLLHRPALL
jgi:hypothetical protein